MNSFYVGSFSAAKGRVQGLLRVSIWFRVELVDFPPNFEPGIRTLVFRDSNLEYITLVFNHTSTVISSLLTELPLEILSPLLLVHHPVRRLLTFIGIALANSKIDGSLRSRRDVAKQLSQATTRGNRSNSLSKREFMSRWRWACSILTAATRLLSSLRASMISTSC